MDFEKIKFYGKISLVVFVVAFVGWFLYDKNTHKKIYIIDSNFTYKLERVSSGDERVSAIWDSGRSFIINNSNTTLILEPVRYSNSEESDDINKYEIITIGTGLNPVKISWIRYIFEEPPKSIKSKEKDFIRWYLHK